MSNLYRGPSIDASCQVSDQLALRFQRRRLKCEKLTDDGRWTPSDGKSSHCLWHGELKVQEQLPNCLKIAETRVVLIIFNGLICDIGNYTVTVSSCCSTWIRYQKCFIRSMTKITLKFIWPPLLALVLKITQL